MRGELTADEEVAEIEFVKAQLGRDRRAALAGVSRRLGLTGVGTAL